MNYDQIKEMTEKDQQEALKGLKELIKAKKISFTGADPLQQYCWISSGSIPGLYFPNTQFNYINDNYQIIAIVKYSYYNTLGLVIDYKYKEDKTITDFYSFDSILYTYAELAAVEKIRKEIKAYNEQLTVIKYIKYRTKKDGGEFADLLKNIEPEPAPGVKISAWVDYRFCNDISIKISCNELKTSAHGDKYSNYSYLHLYNITDLQSIKDEITKTEANARKRIADYQAEIKNIHKAFKAADELRTKLKAANASYILIESIGDYVKTTH